MTGTREPAVAGVFYHATAGRLGQQVEQYIERGADKREVIAIVSPHAGLMYSGPVAGAVYSRVVFPDTFIILGPNHRGVGSRISIMSSGSWAMPQGEVAINSPLAERLMQECPKIKEDPQAHRMEHSLEVQVPFIQFFSRTAKIVPVALKDLDFETCKSLGEAIGRCIKESPEKVVVVSSTDMTHFEPQELAAKKDQLAIDKILSLDAQSLYYTVINNNISMCGYIPTTVTIVASKELGATSAELVKYMTSGDATGDYHDVVGYAGLLIL